MVCEEMLSKMVAMQWSQYVANWTISSHIECSQSQDPYLNHQLRLCHVLENIGRRNVIVAEGLRARPRWTILRWVEHPFLAMSAVWTKLRSLLNNECCHVRFKQGSHLTWKTLKNPGILWFLMKILDKIVGNLKNGRPKIFCLLSVAGIIQHLLNCSNRLEK